MLKLVSDKRQTLVGRVSSAGRASCRSRLALSRRDDRLDKIQGQRRLLSESAAGCFVLEVGHGLCLLHAPGRAGRVAWVG